MGYKKLLNLTLLTVAIIAFVSCGKNSEIYNATYFGGQIINPKSDKVTLMKNDEIIEVIQLHEDNTFLTEFKIESEGLYSFRHGSQHKGYEFQYIYFEPKDSILIRLNTWDFDESLVFSGRGAEKNNFLINLYLKNDKDELGFSQYYDLNSKDFEERIASIEEMNLRAYNQLINSGVEITGKFEELAKVAVSYPLNSRKEIYPWIHRNRFQLKSYPTVSSSYYDFRKEINLNNYDLISFSPYVNYLSIYISSMAHLEKEKGLNMNRTENNLNVIVAHITNEAVRNYFLRKAIYNDFRSAKSSNSINKKALAIFNEYCTDQNYLDQINKLAEDCESIKIQNPIVNFEIASFDNSIVNIESVIKNRKSVIYFWSPAMINGNLLVKRISKLEQKYPSLLFVGINMYPSNNGVQTNKYLDNQYMLTEDSEARSFLKSNEPRTILVDDKGIIRNGFTYLTSPHLERQLTLLEEK